MASIIVMTSETLCDKFEKLDENIFIIFKTIDYSEKIVSISATIANIRLYYFIKQFHENKKGFNELNFLLTNENSTWNKLNNYEKAAVLRKNPNICNDVLVFVNT